MHIEIDQSGKIEQTDMDTIIAFSNNHQYAILLPKQVKKILIRKQNPAFHKKIIRFSNITKRSKAHEAASNVKRNYTKPQKTLSENDVEKLIRGAR